MNETQEVKTRHIIPGADKLIESSKKEKKWPGQAGLIAEEKLSPQIGSSPAHMTKTQEYDIRILTNLNPLEVAWITFAHQMPDHAGGRIFKEFAGTYMYLKRSQAGWTTKNILTALANLRGAQQPRDIARKPNILSRNITNRDWKEKAVEEGKEIVQD
jgi:hypothetical protein